MTHRRIIIMGAAGRDFHNFNVLFRDRKEYQVIAFTAYQIPDIHGRMYPPELAGKLYPDGIPIYEENELGKLIVDHKIDEVIFSYSDIAHADLMIKASFVLSCGADFRLIGAGETMLKSSKPVIAVTAVRTGCGKSQTTRRVAEILTDKGKKVCVIRHPMPYGDLAKQKVQRFATLADLKKHQCTIEEMEEYEPHIMRGNILYAGVDYGAILAKAEAEADVILWDGGNNDIPFYHPDLHITIVDPLRPGHELEYYPGTVNMFRSHAIIINKIDSADPEGIEQVRNSIYAINPDAIVIEAASPITVENYEIIRGKRVLVIEDGPTLTHGEMDFGAGTIAAKKFGAAEIIDPRPYLKGSLVNTFEQYPDIGELLPAMGYGKKQMEDLEKTINAVNADVVIIGTPIDLNRVIKIKSPSVRVTYDLQEIGSPNLDNLLMSF